MACIFAGLVDGTGSTLLSRMVIDNALNIYITGSIYGNIDFDAVPNSSVLRGGETSAAFVVKYGNAPRSRPLL